MEEEFSFSLLSSNYSTDFIAQQLTLLEFSIAKNVKPIEYFKGDDSSDNLSYYFNYMNKVFSS